MLRMCAQASKVQYDYMPYVHAIGEYMVPTLGVIWAWSNVVLSFRTHPQLSSLFLCWLRAFLVFTWTVLMIVYASIPVLFVIFYQSINQSINQSISQTIYLVAKKQYSITEIIKT